MIKDGRFAAAAALCAGALLAALVPSAGASLQAGVDAGGLVLTDVTAITPDGRRFPLSLHSGSPGPLQAIGLHDNQLRLKLPARLRHPHAH